MSKTPSFSIYDASAGSGKTFALVKEYLKIILTANSNDAYRNILAITFTNKAVHEMKSRIVGSLSDFASGNHSSKSSALLQAISSETGMSVEAIQKKASAIIKHLIHNYAAFDISTIDKFTHRVIRAFAHDLNLPMTFEVSLDTQNLLSEAVDAIIARAGEDEKLTKLLVDFTMDKTDDDKSWDISREILDTGRLLLNENDRQQIGHLREKSIEEFLEAKKRIADACKQLDDDCIQSARNALQKLEDNGIPHTSFRSGWFPKHLQSIEQNAFNPKNKLYRSVEDVQIGSKAADIEKIEALLPELISILDCVYKNQEKKNFYKAFLKNITPLSLLNTVSAEYDKIQKEQNILSIAEFNSIIHNEIQNQPAPFIYERLGERYRHFFIDEFQDTSEMQWKNLIPLIDNSLSGQDMGGNKGTLMVVGDPKQSIYRWRGGKAEQFIELVKGHNPFNNPDRELFPLDTNRRSYSEIIHFNNGLFKMLAGEFEHPDYANLYEAHSFQHVNERIGGYVQIRFIPTEEVYDEETDTDIDKHDQYSAAVLETVKQARTNGFQYSDIAVLTRKRSQGISVAGYLSEKGVPILSSETLMVANSPEVNCLIDLLAYLRNAKDAEAKVGILQYLARHENTGMQVHDFIAEGMKQQGESMFEEWLTHKMPASTSGNSFSDIRKKSLYEAVEILIRKFLPLASDNAYLQDFQDIVMERELRNQGGIADFLSYWEKHKADFSIPAPEERDAVKILTIHKAKGLEFPVVIMPYADEDYGRKPKDKLWLNAEEEEMGMPRVLIDNNASVAGFGESAAMVYSQKKQEELLDNINVLYVALTRPAEQLYILSSWPGHRKNGAYPNTMASFFVKYLEGLNMFEEDQALYEFGQPARLSTPTSPPAEVSGIKRVQQPFDPINIRIAQREALMWGTKQQKAIEYGNILHEILSRVKSAKDVERALSWAVEDGLITYEAMEEVRETIDNILKHAMLEPYFREGNKVFNEQTIIRQNGPTVKPDRMVLTDDNKILLLDYKTGSYESGHKHQLESYRQALEDAGYEVASMTLLYIGTDLEIVPL